MRMGMGNRFWRRTAGASQRLFQTHGWWRPAMKWCPLLLVLWPAWALWGLIGHHAINAPFLDDFSFVAFLEKAAHGQLTLHDFFAANMEHRTAWTRVVLLIIHKLWPERCWIAQIWCNWVLLCLTLVNLAIL